MIKEKPCSTACGCVENAQNLPKNSEKKPDLTEIGGFAAKNLPEPTRFGDWEVGGRCSDF
jgi:hypothetical protein